MTDLEPGWGKPRKASEVHYFGLWSNTYSLCKQWRYRGPRTYQFGLSEIVPTCAICRKKLSDLQDRVES